MRELDPKLKEWFKEEILHLKEKDLIYDHQVQDIFKEYGLPYEAKKKEPLNVIKALSIIGAIILGLGLILFVASNWSKIPDFIKTVMLLAVTFLTLYLGYFFSYQKKGYPILGKSLLFLACLFWCASTALIAQIYNIPSSENWWIMLIWALPILPVAYFFESNPVFLLSSGIFLLWNFFYTTSKAAPNYFYPLVVFIILLPMSKKKLNAVLNSIAVLMAAGFAMKEEFEWLVLLVAAGFFVYYFLKKEEIYAFFAGIASFFWMITFYLVRDTFPNYFFIVPLALLAWIAYKDRSVAALLAAIVSFIVWVNLFIHSLSIEIFPDDTKFITSIVMHSLIGVVLYLLGVAHSTEQWKSFSMPYKSTGFVLALVTTYILAFKFVYEHLNEVTFKVYFFACVAFGAVSLFLIFLNFMSNRFFSKAGRYELILIVLLIIGDFMALFYPKMVVNVISMNIILILFGVLAILYGFEKSNSSIFNIGILICVVFIITRYFDIFWGLLDRSIFFIVGGIIMIGGAVWLERKRRKVIKEMGHG